MKTSMRALRTAGLLLGLSASPGFLPAQEVIVGEPIWNQAGEAPDELPKSKGKLRPSYPKELRATDEINYVIVQRYVAAKGENRNLRATGTQAAFQRAVEEEFSDWTMRPAQRSGQAVDAGIWVGVIFNPARSAEKRPDATPRLLSVKPLVVPRRPTPKGAPPIVRMRLSLDETGAVTDATPEADLKGDVREAVIAGLKEWQFAPARKDGHPVASELTLAVICESASATTGPQRVPPKLVKREEPVYPEAMRRFRLEGRVQIDFDVDVAGKVLNPVISQSNNPAFDEPAIEALLESKFEPGKVDGKPAKMRLRQEIHFRMFTGGDDAFSVGGGKQSKIPEEWRYDTPPKIRSVQLPVYPHALRVEGVRGEARATMVIDPRGRVVAVAGLSADHPEFGQALVAALETFQFDPALRGGKPVKSILGFHQDFNDRELSDRPGDWLLGDDRKHPEKFASIALLDHPLKPISQRSPVFPVTVAPDITKGTALVECLVDEKGRVRLPRVVEASDPAFGYAAVQALSTWWFETPMVKGKKVVVRVRVPFEFGTH
jgi:TonB family protein